MCKDGLKPRSFAVNGTRMWTEPLLDSAEYLMGRKLDRLVSVNDQLRVSARGQNEVFAARTDGFAILVDDGFYRAATLVHVARFAPFETDRIRRVHENTHVESGTHLRPVESEEAFHNEEIARLYECLCVAYSRVRGKIIEWLTNTLAGTQRFEVLRQ